MASRLSDHRPRTPRSEHAHSAPDPSREGYDHRPMVGATPPARRWTHSFEPLVEKEAPPCGTPQTPPSAGSRTTGHVPPVATRPTPTSHARTPARVCRRRHPGGCLWTTVALTSQPDRTPARHTARNATRSRTTDTARPSRHSMSSAPRRRCAPARQADPLPRGIRGMGIRSPDRVRVHRRTSVVSASRSTLGGRCASAPLRSAGPSGGPSASPRARTGRPRAGPARHSCPPTAAPR
jgi:hypothetical protein